jgi:Na+/proline symporter
MAIVFGFILFFINIGDYTPEQINFTSVGGSYIIIFLLLGIFSVLSSADIWQRIFAAQDIKTARNASFLSAGLFFIFGTVLTIIGMAAKNNFPNIQPEEALYYGLFQLIPLSLLGIVIVFVLAAIMSTIDTELFYLSSSISKDFLYNKNNNSEEILAKNIRKYILVLAIISVFTAIFFSNILLIIFGIVSLSLSISPALIASFFWKMKNNAVFISMLSGVISLILLVITGNFNADNAIITLPVAIIFLIIGQIVFKNPVSSSKLF